MWTDSDGASIAAHSWRSGDADTLEAEARGLTQAAGKAGREALLVLYNIPHRDCGQFSRGNAGWRTPDALHESLRRVGIGAADGFAVNVSNFQTTRASTESGKQLSAKVGGKPFVIDVSRNGNGPYRGGAPGENWCNPPGRALGEAPTTDTGDGLVDAYRTRYGRPGPGPVSGPASRL